MFAVFLMIPSSQVIAQALGWNIMDGDYDLLLGIKNDTQGTPKWQDSITANPGDSIRINAYYHCGWDDPAMPSEKAKNTKIRIEFPSDAQTLINPQVKISSDNLAELNDSGTIELSSSQKLIFNNTAQWHHNGMIETVNLTVGSNYVEADLGDINCDPIDCFDNPGQLVFSAQVSDVNPPTVDIKANGSDGPIAIDCDTSAALTWTSTYANSCFASGHWSGNKATSGIESTGALSSSKTYTITCSGDGGVASDSVTVNVNTCVTTPNLTISKLGRNLSKGQTSFYNSITGDPEDLIEFKISISSIGNSTAYNVIVKDQLPSNMVYVGNLRVDGSSFGGNIIDGINLGSMSPSTSKIITFEARVEDETGFAYGSTTLTNKASVIADGLTTLYDSSFVNVNRLAPSGEFTISKIAKNLSQRDTVWQEVVSASPGERIIYQITVSAGSNQVANVILKDSLTEKISWHGNTKINGVSTSVDIKDGLNLGTLTSGQIKTIAYEVVLASKENFVFGTTNLINTAMAYNTERAVTDTATVKVVRKAVAGEVTEIPTGVLDNVVLSLVITFAITYLFLFSFFVYQKVLSRLRLATIVRNKVRTGELKMRNWCYHVNPFYTNGKSKRRLVRMIREIKKNEKDS